MKRRDAALAIVGGFLGLGAAPLATQAQQAGKVYRLGYLSQPSRESVEQVLEAFLRPLKQLGWTEGQNLTIEYRWADGKIDRLPELAAELVRLKF